MKINISDLNTEFIDKTYELSVNILPYRETIFLNDTFKVIISSKKLTLGFKIIGKLKALIECQCVRCLEKINLNVNIPINLILNIKPNTDENKINESILLKKNKDYFKLDNIFADMIELTKPYNPLCKKNCKGLCLSCGINLNKNICDCINKKINNPFEKLKSLQIDSN